MPLVTTEVNEESHKALRVKVVEDYFSIKALLRRVLVVYFLELDKA